MNAIPHAAPQYDLQGLIGAIAQAHAEDSLSPNMLTPAQWETLAPYLQPCVLAASQVLFSQGTNDRTLYLIESGSLSVHYEDEKARLRLALVAAGSVVGEGAFFSMRPRSATVQPRPQFDRHSTPRTATPSGQSAAASSASVNAGCISGSPPESVMPPPDCS